jgi:hypothetical protein
MKSGVGSKRGWLKIKKKRKTKVERKVMKEGCRGGRTEKQDAKQDDG